MAEYDVVIVGGGPGGSIAARTSQKLGLNSIIVERGITPGDKNVSGCALSPKLWRDFDFMETFDLPYRTAKMATIHFVDEDNVEKTTLSFSQSNSKDYGYEKSLEFLTINVYRSELDQWLANLAVKEGAELKASSLMTDLLRDDQNNVKGIILDDGTEITGKIVIGADGVISTVAKVSGLREKWRPDQLAWMANYDYSADKEKIDLAIGNNALHYWYSATFPVGYTFFNIDGFHVGLGSILSMVNKNYDPHILLKRLMEVEGIKRQIELVEGEPREYQAHMFPLITDWENIYTDNIMLIGDAAGLACPFEAEGVYYAMVSGQIAAEVAKQAIDKGDFTKQFLKRYDIALRKSHVGEEFEIGPTVSNFVQDLAFNYKPGKWIVPFLNEILYGLCNVSEAHITNGRFLEARLQKYFPFLIDVVIKDFSPMVDAILGYTSKKGISASDRILKKIGSKILPILARFIGKKSINYKEESLSYIAQYVLKPLLEARRPLVNEKMKELKKKYNLKILE